MTTPSDKMTDLQSLSVYLKEQDEKDYKAALGCQDMSLNSSSFWSYGRPSLDLSHVFRNNQFQLASQSQQSHKSWTNDSDYLGEEVWRTLGVTDDLFLWIERLRKAWTILLQELGSDGCVSEFLWNRGGGGGQYGKPWSEHLPTDTQIL
ncbi:TM209-like protein [Mya arenaria]|uniref:TM209-like protein n=1 Tax=Mya arenaria TaxID=6604 RepID=A0ABY7EZI0_MYAAR|nr:TM209-like protein [Mya arenaria]